jgi:hypothetical protein
VVDQALGGEVHASELVDVKEPGKWEFVGK